jgi:hypothetical protein
MEISEAGSPEGAEQQLRTHDETKGRKGWMDLREGDLSTQLDDEYADLDKALDSGSDDDIIHEAADVANIAMMIADNARRKAEIEGGEVTK